MNKKLSLPISYSVNQVYESTDTRFLNVTIDVMHLGENLNESYFDKETVEKELESIKNTPILGYVNNNENKDFEGHEYDITMDDDGEYALVYAGHAYGVIPESCNPRWTTKVASDGVSREYLQVDALMWTKFNDALDIMKRDKIKAQSMEITECEGDYQDDGLFHFTSFKFDGCCILSTSDPNIQPAMVGANVEAFSVNTDSVASEIKRKLSEYHLIFSAETCDGKETAMEDNMNINDVVDTSVVEETESIEPTVTEEATEEVEFEVTEEENTDLENSTDIETEVTETESTEENVEENEVESNVEENFSMSMNQLYEAIYVELDKVRYTDGDGYECYRYWLHDVTDTEVIVYDNQDGKLYGASYSIIDDVTVTVDLSTMKKKSVQYIDVEEATQESGVEFALSKIKELQKECQEYRVIKPLYDNYVAADAQAQAEAEQLAKKEVLESYSFALGDMDEFSALIEKSQDMSIDEIKVACSNLFVNTKKTEVTNQDKSLSGNILDSEVEQKFSAIRERYGIDLIK